MTFDVKLARDQIAAVNEGRFSALVLAGQLPAALDEIERLKHALEAAQRERDEVRAEIELEASAWSARVDDALMIADSRGHQIAALEGQVAELTRARDEACTLAHRMRLMPPPTTHAAMPYDTAAVHLARALLTAMPAIRAAEQYADYLILFGNPPGDWACRECRPQSDMLVANFRCAHHGLLHTIDQMRREMEGK